VQRVGTRPSARPAARGRLRQLIRTAAPRVLVSAARPACVGRTRLASWRVAAVLRNQRPFEGLVGGREGLGTVEEEQRHLERAEREA